MIKIILLFCLGCTLLITVDHKMLFVGVTFISWQETCVILNSMDCAAEKKKQLKVFDMRGIYWKQTSQSLPQTENAKTDKPRLFFSASDLHSVLDLLFTVEAELLSINCGIFCGNSHKACWMRGLRNQLLLSTKSAQQKFCDLPCVLQI